MCGYIYLEIILYRRELSGICGKLSGILFGSLFQSRMKRGIEQIPGSYLWRLIIKPTCTHT